jgi:hypothetical protein
MFAGIAVAMLALLHSPALKAEPLFPEWYGQGPASPLEFEVGTRYWYSSGKEQKTLYDGTGAVRLSRLTWTGETGNSAEGYFNIKDASVFVKGYFGVGILGGGNLQDEDFPAFGFSPYSSTNSNAKNGHLSYASMDLGYGAREARPFHRLSLLPREYERLRLHANRYQSCSLRAEHPGFRSRPFAAEQLVFGARGCRG